MSSQENNLQLSYLYDEDPQNFQCFSPIGELDYKLSPSKRNYQEQNYDNLEEEFNKENINVNVKTEIPQKPTRSSKTSKTSKTSKSNIVFNKTKEINYEIDDDNSQQIQKESFSIKSHGTHNNFMTNNRDFRNFSYNINPVPITISKEIGINYLNQEEYEGNNEQGIKIIKNIYVNDQPNSLSFNKDNERKVTKTIKKYTVQPTKKQYYQIQNFQYTPSKIQPQILSNTNHLNDLNIDMNDIGDNILSKVNSNVQDQNNYDSVENAESNMPSNTQPQTTNNFPNYKGGSQPIADHGPNFEARADLRIAAGNNQISSGIESVEYFGADQPQKMQSRVENQIQSSVVQEYILGFGGAEIDCNAEVEGELEEKLTGEIEGKKEVRKIMLGERRGGFKPRSRSPKSFMRYHSKLSPKPNRITNIKQNTQNIEYQAILPERPQNQIVQESITEIRPMERKEGDCMGQINLERILPTKILPNQPQQIRDDQETIKKSGQKMLNINTIMNTPLSRKSNHIPSASKRNSTTLTVKEKKSKHTRNSSFKETKEIKAAGKFRARYHNSATKISGIKNKSIVNSRRIMTPKLNRTQSTSNFNSRFISSFTKEPKKINKSKIAAPYVPMIPLEEKKMTRNRSLSNNSSFFESINASKSKKKSVTRYHNNRKIIHNNQNSISIPIFADLNIVDKNVNTSLINNIPKQISPEAEENKTAIDIENTQRSKSSLKEGEIDINSDNDLNNDKSNHNQISSNIVNIDINDCALNNAALMALTNNVDKITTVNKSNNKFNFRQNNCGCNFEGNRIYLNYKPQRSRSSGRMKNILADNVNTEIRVPSNVVDNNTMVCTSNLTNIKTNYKTNKKIIKLPSRTITRSNYKYYESGKVSEISMEPIETRVENVLQIEPKTAGFKSSLSAARRSKIEVIKATSTRPSRVNLTNNFFYESKHEGQKAPKIISINKKRFNDKIKDYLHNGPSPIKESVLEDREGSSVSSQKGNKRNSIVNNEEICYLESNDEDKIKEQIKITDKETDINFASIQQENQGKKDKNNIFFDANTGYKETRGLLKQCPIYSSALVPDYSKVQQNLEYNTRYSYKNDIGNSYANQCLNNKREIKGFKNTKNYIKSSKNYKSNYINDCHFYESLNENSNPNQASITKISTEKIFFNNMNPNHYCGY